MSNEAFSRCYRLKGRKEIQRVLRTGVHVRRQNITLFFCLTNNGSSLSW